MLHILVQHGEKENHLIPGNVMPTYCRRTLASSMASAMSPEMQTLEALEKESTSFLEIDTKIQTLNKKHFGLFEVLKREQHERLLEVSCVK